MNDITDLISVQFESKEVRGAYTGRKYTYRTTLNDLAVGDLVYVPQGDKTVQVCAVNVPEREVDERVMPILKTISAKYEKEGKNDG